MDELVPKTQNWRRRVYFAPAKKSPFSAEALFWQQEIFWRFEASQIMANKK